MLQRLTHGQFFVLILQGTADLGLNHNLLKLNSSLHPACPLPDVLLHHWSMVIDEAAHSMTWVLATFHSIVPCSLWVLLQRNSWAWTFPVTGCKLSADPTGRPLSFKLPLKQIFLNVTFFLLTLAKHLPLCRWSEQTVTSAAETYCCFSHFRLLSSTHRLI